MNKIFMYFLLIVAYVTVTNGQTLPPLETLPPSAINVTSIISPFDATCINADNTTDQDMVVFLGAVALNNDNECEVICQRQILQQFVIMFAGTIRTRAVIVGTIFTASMPDNSTCSTTGTCMNGTCIMGPNEMTTTSMPETNSTAIIPLTPETTNTTTNSTNG